MKYLSGLVIGLLLLVQAAFAGNYSYIYIEGDKQTPFYVKLEGQMMPRLGKNYCIVPNLAAGITYVEILFQQNAYPAQKFAILVPEAGSRGFVLQKVNDRQFALYDIQQNSYLVAGNKPEDDHLPAAQPASITDPGVTAAAPVNEEGIPAFPSGKKNKKKPENKVVEEKQPEEGKTDNRFIGDIELNTAPGTAAQPIPEYKPSGKAAKNKKKQPAGSEETVSGNLAAINEEEEATTAPKEENAVGLPNTDCKTPMSSDDFESFALKILDKTDDDARIKVLSKNKGRQCFTTEQVRIIANNLETQSGRYEVVKMLYAQTSDQDNYPALESLFKTNYLKGKFKEILHPQDK